jgi:hypothetical protein
MPFASVRPDTIRFPQRCPHCLRRAEGTYAVAAVRGLDAFIGSYTAPLLLDVPVCRAAFARRRAAAMGWLIVALLLIVALGGGAVWLAIRGAWLAASAVGFVALLLAAVGRTSRDTAVLDRVLLGLNARSLSSNRVRLYMSRADYYKAWVKANPYATDNG